MLRLLLILSCTLYLSAETITCSYSNGQTIDKGLIKDSIVDKAYYPIEITSDGKILNIKHRDYELTLRNPIKRISGASSIELQFYSPEKMLSFYLTLRDHYRKDIGIIHFLEKIRIYKNSKNEKINLTYMCGDSNHILF